MNNMIVSVSKLQKISLFSLLVLSLLVLITSCQKEVVDSNKDRNVTYQELWDTEKFDEIYNSMNYDENSIDIAQNELIFYGFSAYYLYMETGLTEYLNQTKSALERFRLLYSEDAEVSLLSEVYKALSLTYYYLGQYDNVSVNAEKFLSIGITDSKDIQIILGLSYYLSENYKQSVIELSKISNPSFSLNLLLSNLSEKSDFHPQLIEYLDSASELSSNELEKYISNILLVNYYTTIDQYDSVLDMLDLLQAKISSSYLLSSLYHHLGISYYKQGDFIEARTMWNRSLEYNPENIFTLEKLSK
jgi:tetratricopeptide (TPR) repeat protein